jgi:hypothetical protein
MQPTGFLKPRRHLRLGECGVGNTLNVGLRRFKAGKGTQDLVHHRLALIGPRQGTLPWRSRTLSRLLGRRDPEACATFDSCSEETLIGRRQVCWLIAIVLAIKAFLPQTFGVRYSSATPASN